MFAISEYFLFIIIMFQVRKSAKAADHVRRDQDAAIARRLFLVVLTDFCCWCPVGILGILTNAGLSVTNTVSFISRILVKRASLNTCASHKGAKAWWYGAYLACERCWVRISLGPKPCAGSFCGRTSSRLNCYLMHLE